MESKAAEPANNTKTKQNTQDPHWDYDHNSTLLYYSSRADFLLNHACNHYYQETETRPFLDRFSAFLPNQRKKTESFLFLYAGEQSQPTLPAFLGWKHRGVFDFDFSKPNFLMINKGKKALLFALREEMAADGE
jgi:hypothetical protein